MASARTAIAIAGGLAIGTLHLMPAHAAIISTFANKALTSTPFVASFATGAATLSFTSVDTGIGPGAAIATGGTAMVTMIFGGVADYEAGTVFDGSASYGASSTPSVIQYSAADDFVGFTYLASDGTHYGYAEVFGPTLVGYGYNTVAGGTITANAVTSPVPEPATIALVLGAITGLGFIRRRNRGVVAQA